MVPEAVVPLAFVPEVPDVVEEPDASEEPDVVEPVVVPLFVIVNDPTFFCPPAGPHCTLNVRSAPFAPLPTTCRVMSPMVIRPVPGRLKRRGGAVPAALMTTAPDAGILVLAMARGTLTCLLP
ncbi:hypothetical protein DDE74_08705 [Streptomyces lydicus]|uniref:Uncharacterized protein n=1 Tax=Streptomyces lydicus TaxID=47763 RepID=A0A3Q9K851_9ACTN|nr:hypothetical protein DDE74_08705 [Streptomyces lydicus]